MVIVCDAIYSILLDVGWALPTNCLNGGQCPPTKEFVNSVIHAQSNLEFQTTFLTFKRI